jgi:hypothetical protein
VQDYDVAGQTIETRRGRRDVSWMMSKAERHAPACMLAHKMINKLSTIIGNCDLLLEKTEAGTPHAKGIGVIRETAQTAVKELLEHQQQIERQEPHKANSRKAG